MHIVICEDPRGEYKPGEIIEGANKATALKNAGVGFLPYDAELPIGALSPFVQKFYGQGWLFDRGSGERGCPMLIDVIEGPQMIYWAARVRRKSPDLPFSATIRLIHSTGQQRGLGMGLAQLKSIGSTPALDEHGRAIVFGKSQFAAATKGFMFLDLYCTAKGLMVEWVAVSQCSFDH